MSEEELGDIPVSYSPDGKYLAYARAWPWDINIKGPEYAELIVGRVSDDARTRTRVYGPYKRGSYGRTPSVPHVWAYVKEAAPKP
jgi:hypothetical protein